MKITEQRTRLIFTEYNDLEKRKIEDLVATDDKAFTYEDPDNHVIAFPPGMKDMVKQAFPKIPIIDETKIYWPFNNINKVIHDMKPRNQLQIDCINFILEWADKKEKVAAVVSPGTGKTFMACFCAIKVGARTLIITPTSGIKQQWAQTLTDMFKVNPSLVKLVNKPQEFINIKADFAVVSQASLAVLNKTYNLEKIMQTNRFGIKIIDEVQMWWHNMIKVDGNSNICHNWYLTGTFGRSGEDENRIYQEMYHDLHIFREKDKKPTLFNRKPGNIYGMKPHMHVKMVWMKSGLSKEEVQSCMGSMRYSERAGKWVRYGISMANYTELVIPQDGTMTKFLQTSLKIIENAEKEVKYGKTLILSATINSVEVIAGYVRKMFPDKKVYTYHSRNTKQENDEAKKECDILISTVSSCGTGFDLKGLAKLIVLQQFKSWILADQVSGRLRRRDDGKDTYMWDIVDSQIKQLRAWANSRADVLKRKSKSFKVIDM